MTQWFLLKTTVYFSVYPVGLLTRSPFIATKQHSMSVSVSERVSERLPVCFTLDRRKSKCINMDAVLGGHGSSLSVFHIVRCCICVRL